MSKPTKTRVVVTSPDPIPSFARLDAQLLSSEFDVDLVAVGGLGSVPRLSQCLARADALLVWFMGRNAVLPIILARARKIPVVAVIGGFEVAWVERLGYGIMPGSLKERILRRMMAASTAILAVSEYSRHDALSRFPEFESKFRLVPNAVDTARFSMPERAARVGVITVGLISRETIDRKSMQSFSDAAARMPDVPFTLIGPAADRAAREFVQTVPPNVSWLGRLPHDTVAEKLQSASVYFQASVYESFCVAMAEAMSCGCFPVISKFAALPEVAGPTATVMRDLSGESAEIAIRNALSRPEAARRVSRDRIVEFYGLQRRQALLNSIIGSVIPSSGS